MVFKQGLHTSNRVVTEAEFSQIHISVDETLVRISDHQTFRESKSVSLKDLQQTSSPPWIRRVNHMVQKKLTDLSDSHHWSKKNGVVLPYVSPLST